MSAEDCGGATLRTAPLLPTREDRRLAREIQEVASEHFPERWVRLSNGRGVLRTTRWPVTEMVGAAALGGVGLPLGCGLWVSGTGGPAVWAALAVGGALFGALLVALLGGFEAAGRYRRRGGLLSVGGGSGARRRAAILHELCHRMQEVVPGLVEHERAFLQEKLGRPVRAFPPGVSFAARLVVGALEVFRKGGGRAGAFYHPYAGTDPMDGHAYEVLSMGLEGMCYGSEEAEEARGGESAAPFEDHRDFVRRCLREL